MDITTPFVLFDDARGERGTRLFEKPERVLVCERAEDVGGTLAQIDQAIADGFYVAGYLAYELGYLLEPKLAKRLPDDLNGPLIWMGVFKTSRTLDAPALFKDWSKGSHSVGPLSAAITREQYIENVETVRDHIRAGDVYQINYTFKQSFEFSGSPLALYGALRNRQRASFGAVIATGERHILSLSPELFVETQDDTARTRPMKGTAPRAANPERDWEHRHWLCHDEKSKAENLMIVDLLRNDLSRVADVGTVNVTDLFSVETYPTLHQMTSGIEAKLRAGTTFSELLGALFPCGSITGAPKVKAMEIINTLEDGARGVYTGAVGYISASEGAHFNVAIRTLSLDNDGRGEMSIGSGIVYDSDAEAEWDECHLKAQFLTAAAPPAFSLLETFKWDHREGFALLDLHLDRLKASAAYFCLPYDEQDVQRALDTAVCNQDGPQKVRLTLDGDGNVEVKTKPLAALTKDGIVTVELSSQVVDTDSPFTYHKTTNRHFYDDERERLKAQTGCHEVLFFNDRGELTEGSFTNVFIEKNGDLLTPPIRGGLLGGTLRQGLLNKGRCVEAVLTRDDLKAPNKLFLGNAVRGLFQASLNTSQ